MFLGFYRCGELGLLIADSVRAFDGREAKGLGWYWPGAFIGEGRYFSGPFPRRKVAPANPYPLAFNKLGEDLYFFYTNVEAELPGIEHFALLKERWSCWWPQYGDNYPVLRFFREGPEDRYPYKDFVRVAGRASFSYDPWIHEDFRLAGDPFWLSFVFFFERSSTEDFSCQCYTGAYWVLSEAAIIEQGPYRDFVRVEGVARFSYDPWIHEGFRLWSVDVIFGIRFWEFEAQEFRETAPPMVDFSPLITDYTRVFPRRFSLEQVLRAAERYDAQFVWYDPNIIVSPGGRPALERKIIQHLVPAIKALGWHNYPSRYQLGLGPHILKEEPFLWENYPLDFQNWRALHSEDWRIKQYFKKLKMYVKRGQRYEAKKAAEELSMNKWRAANEAKWLAFVRDDPRQNRKGAKDDIFNYKKAMAVWRPVQQNFRCYREF